MTKRKIALKLTLISAFLALSLFAADRFLFWRDYIRMETRYSWKIPLPARGELEYALRSPTKKFLAPGGGVKVLRWKKAMGGTEESLIGFDGRSDKILEARIREDGKAVWLVETARSEVVAALDLETGKVASRCVLGCDGGEPPLPGWASLAGGRLLARRQID